MCLALPKPSHGSWHRDDCNANSQVCRSVCLLRCDTVNGFKLEGPDRRECLATGQWSTPWSSYCKGIVFIYTIAPRISLRADEIKLWLTPSAKQRRNPCSGLPAVYPDLSTRHDWPVKKGFVLFVVIANQVEGEFETHFR